MQRNLSSQILTSLVFTGLITGITLIASSHDLVIPQNENESYGYSDSPQQPWSEYRVHDPGRPLPEKLNPPAPSYFQPAPADATVLFDGTNLDSWEPTEWKLVDGTVECVSGPLTTKETFGAFQLHLEWMSPANFEGEWGNQGNNGVRLQGVYEIQIFDSWKINNYPDGACGAIYGQTPPLVNACTPAGHWQTYDIYFTPCKFDGDNILALPRVTVVQNGVMIQNNQEIYGATSHFELPGPCLKGKGPVTLSGHGCPVRFRNIWIRAFDD